MQWLLLLLLLICCCCDLSSCAPFYSSKRKLELRELVRKTWQHGYQQYMANAFPLDELRPLSCKGQGHNRSDPTQEAFNDVAGDFLLQVVDCLDTFVVMNDSKGFQTAVAQVIQHVSFDKDSKVQVFEVTIRVLGGLLSAHIYASDPQYGFAIPWYTDELLSMSRDLARRMLPAFSNSPSGIPFARINLKHGLTNLKDVREWETCTAGAGSLLLEFATLSRLTGEPIYEQVARKAFFALWNSKSSLSLVGNTINIKSGNWIYGVSSIGAGIDSFFEYMVKSYILLGEDQYWRVWSEASQAVMRHLRTPDGFFYRGVHMSTGMLANANIDSLSAFWPGLLVLAGDIENAIKSHAVFANLWYRYNGLPEVFSPPSVDSPNTAYPLRPELIESTLFLYQATKDDTYLQFAEQAIHDIVNRSVVPCGLASIDDLTTGALEDRMHSFALSETLKYAYLIFDEDNPNNKDSSNAVYTTEGHILPLHRNKLEFKPSISKYTQVSAPTCTPYTPANDTLHHWSPLALSIDKRNDAEYARRITGLELDPVVALKSGLWDPNGFCKLPVLPKVVELLFASADNVEDENPAPHKVKSLPAGLVINDVAGLRVQISKRDDLTDPQGLEWWEISRVARYPVATGQIVLITDKSMHEAMQTSPKVAIHLKFSNTCSEFLSTIATLAAFGPEFKSRDKIQLIVPPSSHAGVCEPYDDLHEHTRHPHFVLAQRGGCTLHQKSTAAARSGASAVIVLNHDGSTFVPSSEGEDEAELIPLAMIDQQAGERVIEALKAEKVFVETQQVTEPQRKLEEIIVMLNGHRLSNVKLSELQ